MLLPTSVKYPMMTKKYLPLLIPLFLQVGCAENPVYQRPAPVHRRYPPVMQESIPTPAPVETYEYHPEENVEPPRPTVEPPVSQTPKSATPISAIEPLTPPVETTAPAALPTVEPPPPAPEPAIPVMPPVSTASFSSPILALATEADQNFQSGQYDAASVKIERALRIDPRNAALTYKLANIRLKQEQPRLAEELAKKAALLAGADRDIKKRSWLLIAESKRLQKDAEGAEKALQKAMQF